MNKNGFLGLIGLVVVLVVVGGGFLAYNHVKTEGLQISSGNLVFDINFNQTNKTNIGITGEAVREFNDSYTGFNESEENETSNGFESNESFVINETKNNESNSNSSEYNISE